MPKRIRVVEPPAPAPGPAEKAFGLDRRWHLARDDSEIDVTEFEYALMRSYEAFARWQSECLAAVTGLAMNGVDNAILHVIRMNDRAKGVKEIGRLTNRDDMSNIQYSIRKLLKAGLIEKLGSENRRKGVVYRATEKGAEVTENYAELRRKLLMSFIADVPGLGQNLAAAARTLDIAAGLYEQSGRIAATHRKTIQDE
ncbi:MAG: winged helix DNA-binding protein [Pseudomonadota bacterium]